MTSVPPFSLEICVVCVGIFLLMLDCFTKLDKRSIGLAAISGLLAILVLSFLTGPMPRDVISEDFYLTDPRLSLQAVHADFDHADDRPGDGLRPDL
jgi:hypothetical protein